MKIKFSPQAGRQEQVFTTINENTLNINGVSYYFSPDETQFPDVFSQTGIILDAYRSDDLYLTVVHYYPNGNSPSWDTGKYQDFSSFSNAVVNSIVEVKNITPPNIPIITTITINDLIPQILDCIINGDTISQTLKNSWNNAR